MIELEVRGLTTQRVKRLMGLYGLILTVAWPPQLDHPAGQPA